MVRSLAPWTLVSALLLASAPAVAEDDEAGDDVAAGAAAEPTLIVLPGAEITEQIIDAGHYHLTVSSDLVVTRDRLWDDEGTIEVLRATLRPLARLDAAPEASFVSLFYFPQPLSVGGEPGTVDGTITHMTDSLLAALPPARERRQNENELGDLTVDTTQFRIDVPHGELIGTIGGAALGDGVIVVYAHIDPSSGPRNRSLIELLESFREGPAPAPVADAGGGEGDEGEGDEGAH